MNSHQWFTMTLLGFGLGWLLLPVGALDASTTRANPGILYVSATYGSTF